MTGKLLGAALSAIVAAAGWAGPASAEDPVKIGMITTLSGGGSSLGISRVVSEVQLEPALKLAFEHDADVVVEQGIDAREIECAVPGNDRP